VCVSGKYTKSDAGQVSVSVSFTCIAQSLLFNTCSKSTREVKKIKEIDEG